MFMNAASGMRCFASGPNFFGVRKLSESRVRVEVLCRVNSDHNPKYIQRSSLSEVTGSILSSEYTDCRDTICH